MDKIEIKYSEELDVYLMHKDIVVGRMSVENNGKAHNIEFSNNYEHAPFGGSMNLVRFHEWWEDRSVPRTRQGATTALKRLGYTSTGSMLVDNLALSLTDCYWIKPVSSDITWKEVNLFENHFIDYFGEITINKDADIDQHSPFLLATSQGEVRKKWVIRDDGTRAMVKGNRADSYQQSLNEIFATMIHEHQGVIPYTTYNLVPLDVANNKLGLGCICNLFTSNDVEFISAWEVICHSKKRSQDSYFHHFKNECLKHGMDEEYFDHFQSYEILTDLLMSNTDRHMNNIGILRNPDTLEWIGFAPIYDTGNSMFFRETDIYSHINLNEIKVVSFLSTEKKLLRYVKYPDIVDLSKLPTKDEFYELYEKDIPDRHRRIDPLWEIFRRKIHMVEYLQD